MVWSTIIEGYFWNRICCWDWQKIDQLHPRFVSSQRYYSTTSHLSEEKMDLPGGQKIYGLEDIVIHLFTKHLSLPYIGDCACYCEIQGYYKSIMMFTSIQATLLYL